MVNYNIADLITRINNSISKNKSIVIVPFTKDNYQILTFLTKLGILTILQDKQYLNLLVAEIRKDSTTRHWFKLISKPGRRVYLKYKDLKDFNKGHKVYLLRTSQGILSSQTAIQLKIGGELLMKISHYN